MSDTCDDPKLALIRSQAKWQALKRSVTDTESTIIRQWIKMIREAISAAPGR